MRKPARLDYARRWGSLILELRREQRVTQRTLARRAGVNRSTLRRLEEGVGGYSIDSLEAVLAVLGYDLDAIPVQPRQQPELTDSERAVRRLLAPCN